MIRWQLLRHPSLPIMLLAGLFTLVSVPDGDRFHAFAMLSLTAFGVSELALALVGRMRSESNYWLQLSRVLNGTGGVAMGFSLREGRTIQLLFTLGILVFIGGLLAMHRARLSRP